MGERGEGGKGRTIQIVFRQVGHKVCSMLFTSFSESVTSSVRPIDSYRLRNSPSSWFPRLFAMS